MADDKLPMTKDDVNAIALALTGFLVSSPKEIVRMASAIVRGSIQGDMGAKVAETYEALQYKGDIDKSYKDTPQYRQNAAYVFNMFRGDGVIDEKQFSAMKNIFLNAAREDFSDRDSVVPAEMMRICSTLVGGEILVLEAASRLSIETKKVPGRLPNYDNNNAWLNTIARESGLGIADMVAHYEESLMGKGLLNKRTAGNIRVDTDYHLSGTGIVLCEFIRDYEPETRTL